MNILGWTDQEEAAFAEIQAASRLSRIQAIQLWKRFRKNTPKALAVAAKQYPRSSQAVLNRLAEARESQMLSRMHASKAESPRLAISCA